VQGGGVGDARVRSSPQCIWGRIIIGRADLGQMEEVGENGMIVGNGDARCIESYCMFILHTSLRCCSCMMGLRF
jgi:hypothetical protein